MDTLQPIIQASQLLQARKSEEDVAPVCNMCDKLTSPQVSAREDQCRPSLRMSNQSPGQHGFSWACLVLVVEHSTDFGPDWICLSHSDSV